MKRALCAGIVLLFCSCSARPSKTEVTYYIAITMTPTPLAAPSPCVAPGNAKTLKDFRRELDDLHNKLNDTKEQP